MKPFVAPMLALMTLTACVPPTAFGQKLRQTPVVENTQFEQSIKILGVEDNAMIGGGFDKEFNNYGNHYYIRSWINKRTAVVTHQLYVSVWYRGEWHYYQRANGQDAMPIPFTEISRDVVSCAGGRGCVLSEDFGIDLSDAVLAANPLGFSVKFYAKDGADFILQISQAQIREQLQAVAQARRALKP